MTTVKSIIENIKTLDDKDVLELFDSLGELLSLQSIVKSIYIEGREHRY